MSENINSALFSCFDNPPKRDDFNTIKWDKNLQKFGRTDLIPLWIADMDFSIPPEVQSAIEKRAKHGTYGYTYRTEGYVEAIQNWLSKRFNFEVSRKELLFYPSGTVSALNMLVNLLTEEGDEVLVQTPSYPPLMNVVKNNGRKLLLSPLKLTESGYQIDLKDLESQITEKTKLLLLCSPHNPSGRVWTESELLSLADICQKNNITVVSDEVHSDIVYSNAKHTHFNHLPNEFRPKSVTIISSCKTFNLAGLPQSTLICDSASLRIAIQKQINNAQINLDGIYSAVATEAAYEKGEAWLEALLKYVQANRKYMIEYIAEHLPKVKVIPAQGTYLAWLDFRDYCEDKELDNKGLEKILVHEAGVGLYNGCDFGEDGEGFFRVNLACPRSILEQALDSIAGAI